MQVRFQAEARLCGSCPSSAQVQALSTVCFDSLGASGPDGRVTGLQFSKWVKSSGALEDLVRAHIVIDRSSPIIHQKHIKPQGRHAHHSAHRLWDGLTPHQSVHKSTIRDPPVCPVLEIPDCPQIAILFEDLYR